MSLEPSRLSMRQLEARMRPGVLSQGGFLGKDESLAEVLAADSQTLAVEDYLDLRPHAVRSHSHMRSSGKGFRG